MKENKNDIFSCYKLVEKCVDFDHIEDKKYILKNLSMVKTYEKQVPNEFYSDIQTYIKNVIEPILYDEKYFLLLNRSEFGAYNEKGIFVINSEESLDKMIVEMYEFTFDLQIKLFHLVAKYL